MITSPRRVVGATVSGLVALVLVAVAALAPQIAFAAPASLSGVVTGPTGVAATSLAVSAVDAATGAAVASSTTSTTGAFSFAGLAAGDYTLRFAATSTSFPQYLGRTSELADAKVVTLAGVAGSSTFLRAGLAPAGTVTGTATSITGSKLAGYTATVTRTSTGGSQAPRSVVTAATGAFSLAGLEPGGYRLLVEKKGAPFAAAGVDLVVAANTVTTKNLVLGKSGAIAGTVSGDCPAVDCATEPLAGAKVTPIRSGERLDALTVLTTATGGYTIVGLLPGTYTLDVDPGAATSATGTVYGRAASATLTVASGVTAAAPPLVLAPTARVALAVIDAAGANAPIGNAGVSIALATAPSHSLARSTTAVDGTVAFTGLGAGSYVVTVGTHVDAIPGDAVAEDTGWQVAAVPVTLGQSQQLDLGSVALDAKLPAGLQLASPVTITPSAAVGETLSVVGDPTSWTAPVTAVDYRWLRNGKAITGATADSYLVRPGDAGSHISLRLTAHSLPYGDATVTTETTAAILPGTLAPIVAGAMTGTPAVGNKLTVVAPTFGLTGVTYSYQWKRLSSVGETESITGATSSGYLVTPLDQKAYGTGDTRLRATVTITREGFAPLVVDLDSTTVALGAAKVTKAAAVTMTASAFVAAAPTLTPVAATKQYSWVVYDAMDVASAPITTASLPKAGTAGKRVEVTVTATADGYAPVATTIIAQKGTLVSGGSNVVTGTARVGEVVTAPAGTITPAADLTYQWFAVSGATAVAIPGATGQTFTVAAGQLDKTLRVAVSAARPGYTTKVVTSALTAKVVAGPTLLVDVAPMVTGTLWVNNTLSVSTGSWSPAAAAYSYQWVSSATAAGPFTPIAGATKSTLEVPANQLDRFLRVNVTATKPGYVTGTTVVEVGEVGGGMHKSLTPATVTQTSPGIYRVSNPGTWAGGATAFSYNWYIKGANGVLSGVFSSNSVTQESFDAKAFAGYGLVLKVSSQNNAFVGGDAAPVVVRVGGLFPSAGWITAPTYNVFNEAFTAPVVDWKAAGATTTGYQWQSSSATGVIPESAWTNIPNATKSTLVPGVALIDKVVRVVVTGIAPGYTSTVFRSNPISVAGAGQLQYGSGPDAPSIAGIREVGATLTGSPGTWSEPGVTYEYRWLWAPDSINYLPEPIGTGKTLVFPATKFVPWGSLLLRIEGSKPGFQTNFTYVNPGYIMPGALPVVKSPVVTKNAAGAYAATAGIFSPAAVTTTYAWETVAASTGVATVVGTAATYTPIAADAGKQLRVRVTAKNPNPAYKPTSVVVVARAGTAIANVAAPTVSGVTTVGETLSVGSSTWNTAGTTLGYQWKRNGVAIAGAKATTYVQTTADIGTRVSVTVSATLANYTSASTTVSAAANTLSALGLQATVAPSVSGAGVVGTTLAATGGTWNATGLTLAYQWLRDGAAIPGATAASYALTAADAAVEVSVRVTASKANVYYPVAATSPSRTVALGTLPTFTVTPAFSGPDINLNVGETATAKTSALPAGAVVSYQWLSSADGTGGVPIVGANGATFAPLPAHAGFARVEVTISAPGYVSRTASSAIFRVNL